jgi:hypothetical protein
MTPPIPPADRDYEIPFILLETSDFDASQGRGSRPENGSDGGATPLPPKKDAPQGSAPENQAPDSPHA